MRANDLSEAVRSGLRQYDAPYQAHRGVVPSNPSRGNISMGGREIAANVMEAERVLVRLTGRFNDSSDLFVLTRILERQEAIGTSSIEGIYSTLDALLEFEEQGYGQTEARETYGVTLALDLGLERVRKQGVDAFTVAVVCELHKRLTDEIDGFRGKPGCLRETVVWIGGTGDISTSTWNPPPPEYVIPCLEDTLDYMRTEPEDISQFTTIVPLAVAHAHFEAVHPFSDGNGRIGRLLISLMLAARGLSPLYLSPWIDAHKSEYYASLKKAQQSLDYSGIIDCFSRAIIETEKELNVTMSAIECLEAHWSGMRLRRNSTASRALPLLKSWPVMRVETLARLLDVSFKSASDGLLKLVEVGVMREKTGYSRNRIFTSPDILRILMRPFGEEPDFKGSTGDFSACKSLIEP